MDQRGEGIHLRQFSRAFVIEDADWRIAFVSIDSAMMGDHIRSDVSRNDNTRIIIVIILVTDIILIYNSKYTKKKILIKKIANRIKCSLQYNTFFTLSVSFFIAIIQILYSFGIFFIKLTRL